MSSTAPTWTWPAGNLQTAKAIISATKAGKMAIGTRADNLATLLMVASRHGWVDDVAYLLDAGEDINAANEKGHTALIYAVAHQHLPVVQYLLQHGPDIECRTDQGTTPLIAACMFGNLSTVKCLVAAGADINAEDQGGATALDIAKAKEYTDIIKYLEDVAALCNIAASLKHENAALRSTISERDATIQQLNSQINERSANYSELQLSYERICRDVRILQECLSKCACEPVDVSAAYIPEVTDCNYPEIVSFADVSDAVMPNAGLSSDVAPSVVTVAVDASDSDVNKLDKSDLPGSNIAHTEYPHTFASVQSCLDEINACYASVKEALARLNALENSGIAAYNYAWNANCDATGKRSLLLVEDTSVLAVGDVVTMVHKSISGIAYTSLSEFAVPIPGVSMKWNVSTIHDITSTLEALVSLSSWFTGMLSAAGHGVEPAPWLIMATRNMQHLRSLCQQYEQACTSYDTRAAFAEFTRLCARKQVFTPAARSLLQRLKASDEVWIRPASA